MVPFFSQTTRHSGGFFISFVGSLSAQILLFPGQFEAGEFVFQSADPPVEGQRRQFGQGFLAQIESIQLPGLFQQDPESLLHRELEFLLHQAL